MATLNTAHPTTLLTEREVADLFRVTRRTIQRWESAGTLRAVRIGGVTRYRVDDVDALIDPSPNDIDPGGEPRVDGKASDDALDHQL